MTHLRLYPREITSYLLTETCIIMFILSLFSIIPLGNKCPSKGEFATQCGLFIQWNTIQ